MLKQQTPVHRNSRTQYEGEMWHKKDLEQEHFVFSISLTFALALPCFFLPFNLVCTRSLGCEVLPFGLSRYFLSFFCILSFRSISLYLILSFHFFLLFFIRSTCFLFLLLLRPLAQIMFRLFAPSLEFCSVRWCDERTVQMFVRKKKTPRTKTTSASKTKTERSHTRWCLSLCHQNVFALKIIIYTVFRFVVAFFLISPHFFCRTCIGLLLFYSRSLSPAVFVISSTWCCVCV